MSGFQKLEGGRTLYKAIVSLGSGMAFPSQKGRSVT